MQQLAIRRQHKGDILRMPQGRPKATHEPIRRYLRALRAVAGITQEDMSERLGLSRSSIAMYETGTAIPPDIRKRITEIWQDPPPPEGFLEGITAKQFLRVAETRELFPLDRKMKSGSTVLIPVWRGVSAGADDECYFQEPDSAEYQEVGAFLIDGDPERHILVIVAGDSMVPRIEDRDRVVVRLDPDVAQGHLVVAQREDGQLFIKRLIRNPATRRTELHSVNERFAPITDLTGWQIRGGVVAIRHMGYPPGIPSYEFEEGRYLTA